MYVCITNVFKINDSSENSKVPNMSPYNYLFLFTMPASSVQLKESKGYVAQEFVTPYQASMCPPGISEGP